MKFRRRDEEPLSLNVTPLIDVVFLLLIFFMVTTTFSRESSLNINLPEASAQAEVQKIESLEVSVNAQGEIYVNQQHLVNKHKETLRKALAQILDQSKNPLTVFKIIGDAKAPHQSIIDVMDVAGELGIQQIQLATVQSVG